MPGGISGLLDTSRRALFAQTQAIRVIGNNIANVNTEGYSRRRVELTARGTNSDGEVEGIGAGVSVNRIIRVIDSFLESEFRTRISDLGDSSVRSEFLSRAETAFSLDTTVGRIGFQLTEFFGALEDLAADPANIPLRSNVIDKGQSLTQSIQTTYDVLADLQREANNRIQVFVDEVNQLSSQIAELNGLLAQSGADGQENLGLLDQREMLIRQLSEKLAVKTVTNSDGTVLVTLENGFGLVTGTESRDIQFTTTPSFAPGGGYPPGLDGQALGHIVYDYDPTAGTSHIDLTGIIAASGGEIGGLLQVRGVQDTTDTTPFDAVGSLVDVASRVEAIAQDLLTRFNTAYLGADENGGLGGLQPSSGDLSGTGPGVYGLFSFAGAVDSDADGIPDDLSAIGLSSYASQIEFGVSDPSDIAAALDLDPAAGATSFAPGDGSNLAALIALRDTATTYSVGNFSMTTTIEDLYNSTVTYVGSASAQANGSFVVAKERHDQQQELKAAVSGVNLDEELANLINFQRAFEASARMIGVGDQLFQEILSLLG